MNLWISGTILLLIVGWAPINVAYGCSIWLGGNFTYGNNLAQAISSFDTGNLSAAEADMQKAMINAESYPFAVGPDAGIDLAKRTENAGAKGLKNSSSYARAAFLYEYAQAIRSHFSTRATPWLLNNYFFIYHYFSRKLPITTRINTARAFNLVKRYDDSEAILTPLANELLNHDSQSLFSKFIGISKKNVEVKVSKSNLQYLVLIKTEMVDVHQQKGLNDLADSDAKKVLQYCAIKKVYPETIKECAKRLREMGRNADALAVYEELHKLHYKKDDD